MRSDRLGVQAHCLRHRIAAAGLQAALDWVRQLGLGSIELVCFPGCRGNPWGDFGLASDLAPGQIKAALSESGLHCPSVMVTEAELSPGRIESTLAWVAALGCSRVVLGAVHSVPPGARGACFLERVYEHARRCQSAGFHFVLHTQPELWMPARGPRPADALLAALDTSLLRLEFDPTGAILYGADPAEYLRQRPDAFYAMHLRDGARPDTPVPYLPADPLGAGGIDWKDLLDAAKLSSIEWFFLEMEVSDPNATRAALEQSLAYLERNDFMTPFSRALA